MRPESISRRNFILIFGLAIAGTACVEPTTTSTPWDPTKTLAAETVVPLLLNGEINTIKDEAVIQKLVESLPEDKPSIDENFPVEAFEIKVGEFNLPFVIYNIDQVSDMQIFEANIPDQGKTWTIQNIALFAPIVKKDKSVEMTRLGAIFVPGTDPTKDGQVIWYYQPNGFPNPETETPVDLTQPALLYNIKASTGIADCQAYYEPKFKDNSTKPSNWDGKLLQINTCVTEPTATKSLLSPVNPDQLLEIAYKDYPEIASWGWHERLGLVATSFDKKTNLVYNFKDSEWLKLLTEPTADELTFAKKDTIADEFTFANFKWNVSINENNERVWTREDGKVNLEWASLYGGGIYNAYMFVTRSEKVEGKRSLEIYTDPRDPIFYHITGNSDVVDSFILKIADATAGDAAQAVLLKPDSTLKLINGGLEYFPVGGSRRSPQRIYYKGLNGEDLWQDVWGYVDSKQDGSGMDIGYTGPFVELDNKTIECATYYTKELFQILIPTMIEKPDSWSWTFSGSVFNCISMDPEATTLYSGTIFDVTNNLKNIISLQIRN